MIVLVIVIIATVVILTVVIVTKVVLTEGGGYIYYIIQFHGFFLTNM